MDRRKFLAGTVGAAACAVVRGAAAENPAGDAREFYQVRKYCLQSGPQLQLMESYFGLLVPQLNRMGMGPVGAFKLDIGPETPTYYLLIPGKSVEALATIDLELAKNAGFMNQAASFWNAPAASPAFLWVDTWLLSAFEGWPRVTAPPQTATKEKRIFQMRTYESVTMQDHVRKVEMFHSGEFESFQKAGAHPVFFGDTLVGSHMPSLTYMLSFADMEALEADWAAFSNDPAWKKLKASPRFSFEAIVTNITNLVLSPLAISQI